MGAEICISRSTCIGSGGARDSRLLFRLHRLSQTFFLVQTVAREYLLLGLTGSLVGGVV